MDIKFGTLNLTENKNVFKIIIALTKLNKHLRILDNLVERMVNRFDFRHIHNFKGGLGLECECMRTIG